MSQESLVVDANRLVERINEAKRLRAEGADEETILAVEPTKEEVRAALLSLRSSRAAQSTPTPRKRAQSKMSIDELFGDL